MGGARNSKSTEHTNSSTSSIRGEIIPMHCNLFSLNPPKNIKKPSNNGDSIGIAPLEMSKSSHLLQLNNSPILISQGSCVGTSQQSSWIRCPAWRRDAVTPRPRASSPRRCSQRCGGFWPSLAWPAYERSSLTTEIFFQTIGVGETRWHHYIHL